MLWICFALALSQNISTEFEVASIKLTAAYDGRILVQLLPGGGLRTSGATAKYLVTLAYDVPHFQVSGPGWIESERFDVIAKAAGSEDAPSDARQISPALYKTRQQQMRPKLQALLADRFQLKLHREKREQPVYTLVRAKGGSKLQPSKDFRGLSPGNGQMSANGATLEMLATALAGKLGRPVLDRTGLTGAFDFKLDWTPDAAAELRGPSIFSALQEQLGLKLESIKAPVEILVIDRIEKPSEN